MQSVFISEFANKPHFSSVMADAINRGETIRFLKTIKKNQSVEVKVYFSATKIFLVYMENRQQQRVIVRERSPMTSLLGEATRLTEVH